MSASGETPIQELRRQLAQGMALAAATSFFVSLLMLALPLFTMQVYDRVMSSRSLETLGMLAIITCGALALYGLLDYLRARVFIVLGDVLSRKLNVPTLQAAIGDTLAGGKRNAAQALRDLGELRSFLGGGAITVPLELLWCPVFLVVLFLMHPVYGAVALGGAALLTVAGLLTDQVTRRQLEEANDAQGRAFADVAGTIRHAEVIEAMGMLPAVAGRWQAAQKRMSALTRRGSTAARAMASASRSLRLMLQVATIATGMTLILETEASPGSIMAAGILVARMLAPFENLIDGWRQWVGAIAALKRVQAVLEEGAARRDTTPLPRPAGKLVVDRLTYVPPGSDRPVLRAVSFTLGAGEVVGIVGPSGAGKSTLARMIVGLWPPTAGGCYLDGHSTFAWERESFGRHVGYLPQSVALLDASVRENIARLRQGDTEAVVRAARMAGVHELVGRLPYGYDTLVGDGAYSLSGGQKQRIALARALYGMPALLVLDEPNANLDGAGEQALVQAVREAKAAGTSVVLIAHRPSIMEVADKLLVLKDGMVEQFGPRPEVLRAVSPQKAATVTRLARPGSNS